MSNILVTGGAGYIGSHACKALACAGYTPVSYDNLVYGHERAVKWGPFEKGDILDRERLDRVLRQYKPEAVMHFAAYAYVGESVEQPEKYYRNNIFGSFGLLEAMRDNNVHKIVFSSTCAVYGEPTQVPINEQHPCNPVNPYGASKLTVEHMLRGFHAAHGLRSISLRYFNAAGADLDGEVGEDHDPETHLIPLVLDAAAGVRPSITIYGDDYDTPDGSCIRDYIHVTDLANAHVRALNSLNQNEQCTYFNLGIGAGYSVQEVIERARRVTGKSITAEIGPRRPGDPPRLIADAARAHEELCWQPVYTELETIVQTAWEWHLKK